jgi:hypothetical protein
MLARIRVGDRRFIAATSGPPARLAAPATHGPPSVLRDLDLTAAYGIEAAHPPKGQRGRRIPVNRH